MSCIRPKPIDHVGQNLNVVQQHAAYLEVDNVGHGLFVVQMLDVLPRLRLRAADEVPCHLMVIEPPFRMVLVWVAVLPSHLPMCIPGVIRTVSSVLTLFQGRLRAATRHSYVSRWCGTAAEQAGKGCMQWERGRSQAHASVVLLCLLRSLSCLGCLQGLYNSPTITRTAYAAGLKGHRLALQHAGGMCSYRSTAVTDTH